jgi:uncharacterized protein YeaC (DUF1315 family)
MLKSHIHFRYYTQGIALAKIKVEEILHMCVLFIGKRNLLQDKQTLDMACQHIQKNVQKDANTNHCDVSAWFT